ncbi:MAG: chemotaxis protein CheW [Spirochaetaceae bacterium]|nr:chemotaxis protein CheW [Spirochaetaceae bacterium]
MMYDDFMQLVTFNLGKEEYGIDIMKVEGIVREEEIRSIPNAPLFVEGVFNLRGEIIPVISLHKRFFIDEAKKDEADDLLRGFIIIRVNNMKLAVKIDKVSKVTNIDKKKVQQPPQMNRGIGSEYIQGVTSLDDQYIIILDIERLFALKELKQLEILNKR